MPRLTPDEVRVKVVLQGFETLASDDDPQVNGLYRGSVVITAQIQIVGALCGGDGACTFVCIIGIGV